jgi:ketosteroid isomerase-like protein
MSAEQENYKVCVEAMNLQAEVAKGVVDPSMFAEFASKFPKFFADKFDLTMGPGKVAKKAIGFPEMMASVQPIFEGIKNSSVVPTVTVIDANTMSVETVFKSVYTDAHGNDVPNTAEDYVFTTVLTYDAAHKITHWNQTWDVGQMDRARALEAVENEKIFERNKGLFGEIMSQWGAGAFNSTNPDAKAVANKLMAPDFVADARYNTEYQTGWKRYEGPDGCLEWCGFLEETWAMPDFTVNGIYQGPKGEVWAAGSSTPMHIDTGKKMPFPVEFIHRVNFNKEGKCTYFKFYNSPVAMYQDALVNENEAAVQPMIPTAPRPAADKDYAKNIDVFWKNMAAWGSGIYNGPKEEALAAIAKCWSKDCFVDFRYPLKSTTTLSEPFKGHEGIFKWCAILAGWDMPDFTPEHVTEGEPGEIIAKFSFTSTVKATGKLVGKYDTLFRCTVVNGLIVHATMHQGPGAELLDAAHTPDANKFFIVEHAHRSPEKAQEWWAMIGELFEKPELFKAMQDKQRELGFFNHQFLPEAFGTDKPMQCLWECTKAITKEQFQQFIDGPHGPDPKGCVINTVYPVMQGAVLPGTGFFVPNADAAPETPAATRGAFFWVKHDFKDANKFWEQISTLKPEDWKGLALKNNKLGFHNHTFAPCAAEGPAFCLWESEKDVSVEEFQAFVDGVDGPGYPNLINHVHKCDANAGAKPTAKFAQGIPGAMLPVKEAVPSAAVANSRATAA